MIACPVCGGPTGAKETRSLGAHVRRRRQCVSIACGARVTTVELVVPDHRHLLDPIAVPRALFETIAKAATAELEAQTRPSTDPAKPR